MSRKYLWVLPCVSILAVVMTGCSGNSEPQSSPTSRPAVTTTAATVPTTVLPDVPMVPTVTSQSAQLPLPSPVVPSSAAQPTPVDCNEEHNTPIWGTEKRVIGNEPPDPGPGPHITQVEYAQHSCDDWFVVRIPADVEVDVIVHYSDEIREDATGDLIDVVGGAKLYIVIGIHGEQWAPRRSFLHGPAHFAQWGAFRDVRFAGTHEGLTSFALGVVERNAFTVSSEYWDGMRRIAVKIAH